MRPHPQELNEIENAFINVLSGVYHERVEYPELPSNEPSANGGRDTAGSSARDEAAGLSSKQAASGETDTRSAIGDRKTLGRDENAR